jgi:hypothetical protein
MLHVATVHYRSPRWIEIQARHLREHISTPFQTWTSLEAIDASYAVHFDHVLDQAGQHAGKLNNLALEISHAAADDDRIMFLDGDAFPIADPIPLVEEALAKAPLVAVRRAENLGDQQPHPCFCVTTVKTWRELPGDWSPGYRWTAPDGRHPTDVGGNLLRALELSNTPWVDVLRSNRQHVDPLHFAIYGGVIYHHGAGFRRGGAARGTYDGRPKPLPLPNAPIVRELVQEVNKARMMRWRARTRAPQIIESKRVYEKIERGDPTWLAEIA